MLVELRVRDLGVIEEVTVELGLGMTALTGETGAGKTLVVEALELLLGGRADPVLVRPGATEALIEGRFVVGDDEFILARSIPARGRSRAWVDGRMAPISALAEAGARLVDLHGQHAHQSLLDPAAQRRALDGFAGVDTSPVVAAAGRLRDLDAALAELGGDERVRARETDLLRYQLDEIERAAIEDADEDERLAGEESLMAGSAARREAAVRALARLNGAETGARDTGAGIVDQLGECVGALQSQPTLASWQDRLAALQAEALDVAGELRDVLETWEDDPARQEEIRTRRQMLRDLRRKYGETLAEVQAYGLEVRSRLDVLESVEERAAALGGQRGEVAAELAAASAALGRARRSAAPGLASAVEIRLRDLAMARARIEVTVGEDDPGDEVTFLLGANPGEPVLPLSKVASGGELARTMLALRLVLTGAPPTMVFDEVDAGIGGEAARAVGRALAEVAAGHQVLVVTHLAQVAAFADRQLGVAKTVEDGRTVARVSPLDGSDRVVELARMLSGQPDSAAARRHAEELLASVPG